MKNYIRIALGVLLLAAVPLAASAVTFRHAEQATVGASETIGDDLYIAGGQVTSAGTISGDMLAAGGTVIVSGATSQDLTVAGGNITITGSVGDDLRAAGGNLVLTGRVAGDLVAAGGQLTIGGEGVRGDAALAGGAITVTAPVYGNLKIAGGEVTIDAPIVGNVEIKADKVTLGSHASIDGNLTYTASEEATVADGARVVGTTKFTKSEAVKHATAAGAAGLAAVVGLFALGKFLMMLVGALLIGYLLSRYSQELVARSTSRPLKEIGRGLVTLVVLPIASVILLVTVVGIPLGLLGLISYAALLLFASLTVPIVIGAILHKWIWKPEEYVIDWRTIVMGAFVYFVVGLIPFLGWIVNFGILLLVLGAMVGIKWTALKEWQ